MYIGYNVAKINEVMDGVNESCIAFSNKVSTNFEAIRNTMRTEWVGPDQQDFEEALVKRLNKLLNSAESMAEQTNKHIRSLAEGWIEFQNKNTIDGKKSIADANLAKSLNKASKPTINPIPFTAISFEAGQNMGLANEGSLSTLQDGIQTFVTGVKNDAKTMFDQIGTQNAFFGPSQQAALKVHMEKVGEALGVIETSIKDFNEAMAQLTNGNYMESDSLISTQISELGSQLETELGKLNETRWS